MFYTHANETQNKFHGSFHETPSLILVFVLAMMVLEVFGLMNMLRREFPEFTICQGVIVGIFPGASSQEVEEQLTREVENYIFS